MTSHDVVDRARRGLGIRKVGHAGTLDPMATGLLVLGAGRVTRLLRFVQAAPKTYVARVVFGVATDTLDADGAVLDRTPMPVEEEAVRAAATRFLGRIAQVPPMVSARKVEGRRLYELAREGVEVEREAREVEIHDIDVVEFSPCDYPEAVVRVRCSTGTYVRTLTDDIARSLGGRAHLSGLRRLSIGSLHVGEAHPVDAVAGPDAPSLLIPPAEGLRDLPALLAGAAEAGGVLTGAAFAAAALGAEEEGPHRVLDGTGRLLAVYDVAGRRALPEVVLS
jgi:tRNA pseudouridine55 synthase